MIYSAFISPLVGLCHHICDRQSRVPERISTSQAFSMRFLTVSIGHRLVSGKYIGQAAHVTGALDIILTSQGIHPAACYAQVSA